MSYCSELLSLDEVLKALEVEKAMDVRTINLEGKSNLAQYMVFCTGRSRLHMRNMADLLVDAVRHYTEVYILHDSCMLRFEREMWRMILNMVSKVVIAKTG